MIGQLEVISIFLSCYIIHTIKLVWLCFCHKYLSVVLTSIVESLKDRTRRRGIYLKTFYEGKYHQTYVAPRYRYMVSLLHHVGQLTYFPFDLANLMNSIRKRRKRILKRLERYSVRGARCVQGYGI